MRTAALTALVQPLKSAVMAVREILILPDKRLRLVSEPVKTIDREIKTVVADMFDTMYDAPGIGLAAIQVGVPRRIVTMDLAKKEDEEKQPRVFINPEILWKSEEKAIYEEGCLSIPEFYEEVERPAQVRVKYLDLEGREQRAVRFPWGVFTRFALRPIRAAIRSRRFSTGTNREHIDRGKSSP